MCVAFCGSHTVKASFAKLDLLHERGIVVRAGRDDDCFHADWVGAVPTEVLPAIVGRSGRQGRALGGDRRVRRPFAPHQITDGPRARIKRRGVAPRQEQRQPLPDVVRYAPDIAWLQPGPSTVITTIVVTLGLDHIRVAGTTVAVKVRRFLWRNKFYQKTTVSTYLFLLLLTCV